MVGRGARVANWLVASITIPTSQSLTAAETGPRDRGEADHGLGCFDRRAALGE
jgi:hypothetical protein